MRYRDQSSTGDIYRDGVIASIPVLVEGNRGTVLRGALHPAQIRRVGSHPFNFNPPSAHRHANTRAFPRNVTISVRETITLSLVPSTLHRCVASLFREHSFSSRFFSLFLSPLISTFYSLTRSMLPPLVLPARSLPPSARVLSHRLFLPRPSHRLQHAITHASFSHTHTRAPHIKRPA